MRIVLIGYYGHNNFGGELNLFEVMKLLYKQYPDCKIDVYSGGLSHVFVKSSYELILADPLVVGRKESEVEYDG